MFTAVADHDIMRLQLVKHGFGIGTRIAMMPGNNNVCRVKLLAYGCGRPVNGRISGVDIGKIDHGIVSVGHNRHDRIDVLVAGVGLFMDIIQTERHISHGERDIIAVSIAGIPVNNLLLGDVHQIGPLVLHGFGRLVIIGLIVPGQIAVTDKVVFDVVDMLVLLIEIRRISIDQIADLAARIPKGCCGNFRHTADMVAV